MEILDVAMCVADERNKAQLDKFWDCFCNYNNANELYTRSYKWTAKDFPISAKTDADFRKLLGQRYKKRLGQLMSFIDLYQYCTSRKRITELGISSNTPQLIEVLGYQERVSRTLGYAKDCGLLSCVDNLYSYKDGKPRSKRYIYNKAVQDAIKELVDKLKIDYVRYVRKNDPDYKQSLAKSVRKSIKDKIRVGTKLRIERKAVTDKQIKAVLDERYPMVVACRKMADEDNKSLNSREQIKCEWNISESSSGKYINKIGFRMTSGIVSLKEHENSNKDYSGVWRHEYLAEQFGYQNKVYEFDVKSSIFRVTYFLNFGEWLDNDIDLYELMAGVKFRNDAERDAYKAYKMRPYFDSGKDVVKHIMPVIRADLKGDVSKVVEEDIARSETVIGKSWKSEIFVHESCIYMMLVHRLRKLGFKVIQVYDGFYSDRKDFADVCKKELKKVVEDYAKSYLRINNKIKIKQHSNIKIKTNKIQIQTSNQHQNININNRHEFFEDDMPDMRLDPKTQETHDKLVADITKAYKDKIISSMSANCLMQSVTRKYKTQFFKPDPTFKPNPKNQVFAKKLAKRAEAFFRKMITYTYEPEPTKASKKKISFKDYMM